MRGNFMKEMHHFKKSWQEEIPSPEFKDSVTAKLLLGFLCDVCEWAHAVPFICRGSDKDGMVLYAVYRNVSFSGQDYWQTFGGYIVAMSPRWQITAFGTELFTQETVKLSLDIQDGKFYAMQETVSGGYADNINSLCLRIQAASESEAEKLYALCQAVNWQSGILVGDWDLSKLLEEENIAWLHKNSCYCYGAISEYPEQEEFLDALDFRQKQRLWLGFLKNGFDYAEFSWLYEQIFNRVLNNRIEWELSLQAVLNKLNYTLKNTGAEFELYDGDGKRCYFSFNSDKNAVKALLKLLFPLTAN